MKRKGARRNFKFIQPVAYDARRPQSPTYFWRWISGGLVAIVLAGLMSWPPWADPGILPLRSDARSALFQPTPKPPPVLSVTQPSYRQGIFIVSGNNFVPGERVLLFAQPANAAFIVDVNQAYKSLIFLQEVLVGADGRLYAPINPLLINIRNDILSAIVVAYTAAGVVPSVITIDLYTNIVLTPVPGVPALPATPVPFHPEWQMGGYAASQLSGQQRPSQTVPVPKCEQLNGDDRDNRSLSARWTTQLDVPLHAHYSFALSLSGSARLSIDGAVIIDEWRLGDHERTRKVFLHLMHGLHDVQLDYSRPRHGRCKLSLAWRTEYPDWCGVYRNNTDFTGDMVAFRNIDSTSRRDGDHPLKTEKDSSQFIYINWETNAAAAEVNPDNWSVDITRTIVVTETGYYKFAINVGERDEARAYIDQHPIIDQWVSGVTWSPPITLSANQPHFVQVQFRDLGGPSMLHFAWIKLDWPN